jgi:uncharacterized membrane protein (UPF0182 family)
MYILILLILLGGALAVLVSGIQSRRFALTFAGILIGLFTVFFFWFMGFWGEMLWFESLGYTQRFLLVFMSKAGFAAAGVALGWFLVWLLTRTIAAERRFVRLGARVLGALIGLQWGLSSWDILLKFMNRVSTDLKDPILGRDTGFYLFTLPFYDTLYGLLLLLALVSLGAVFVSLFVRLTEGSVDIREPERIPEQTGGHSWGSLYWSAALLVLVLAWGKYLNRFHLMYSTWGAVTGAGWTDVHIRLPAYTIVSLLTAGIGLALVVPPLRDRLRRWTRHTPVGGGNTPFGPLAGAGVAIAILWFVALTAIPGLFQWLRVEPNEITFEKPYIEHNIRFTRDGFRLNEIEEREFPASGRFTQQMVEDNRNLFSNIRLWDHRALDAVYKQFQEIRLYYEFTDVDIDRYAIDQTYRQVMVSARELEPSNLPADSQTFVNRRFKYTHGYGITLTTVSEFTPQGLPNLLIRDIPPQSEFDSLEVKQPQIYYGELTRSHVVVNSQEQELDYPRGEENVYVRYKGRGGVRLSHIGRKFLYGWKFDGTRFFLSGYPTSDSRIMFHRQIQERIRTVAPFLHFDKDPYIVLSEGKLYWIIDGYTTSDRYPYSEPFSSGQAAAPGVSLNRRPVERLFRRNPESLRSINYIRNSIKAVVDAFDGSVDLYVFEEKDPLIRVWQKVFPDLFKAKEEMPQSLYDHIRYPVDMLLVQGLVYAKYHMSDPTVFYNQEDLWVRATEKYYNNVQPVEPYYIMWEPPGKDRAEFVLILPFTPKNRQVLIGWIAGMCDPGNYGRLLAYKFPKEKRVLGTQQVETKIDQDRFLSGQLTLWDQRGSNVIRGNVLVIPIEETLLYVEPVYLQAETAAYPELRLVVLMHGDILSYAETFEGALKGLLGEAPAKPAVKPSEAPAGPAATEDLIRQASEAFENYLDHLSEKRFREAGESLERLQGALEQLSQNE